MRNLEVVNPMNPIPLLLIFTPNLAFRRAASRILARETSADQAARVWDATKSLQADLRKKRPRHSVGLNLVLRYYEWDTALYRAATQEGLSEATAGRMVEEINWAVLGPSFALSYRASRLRSKHLRTRLEWVVDWMFRVIFTAPFERTIVPSEQDVAFNVTVCPLAQYFRDRGVPELTRYAACGLDYRMAALWGVGFEREQTIAAGHSLCDFRFRVPASTRSGSPLIRPRPSSESPIDDVTREHPPIPRGIHEDIRA